MKVAPTPTEKLDSQNLANFDFTNRKLELMTFSSRQGAQQSQSLSNQGREKTYLGPTKRF